MARLSREEQREYEAELEYQRTQPVDIPDKNRSQSTMDRIVTAAKSVGKSVQNFNNGPTGRSIRTFAEHVNSQDTMSANPARRYQNQEPRSVRRKAFEAASAPTYPQGPPVNQMSALHPGNRIYVLEGNIIASGKGEGGQQKPQRRTRTHPLRDGGLEGGNVLGHDDRL